jgi:transcriptional regulator with XRE-family HTH domain
MKALDEYMIRKGLTQVDMADLLGVPQGQVSHWLGGRKPTVKSLKLIARKTGLSLKKLVEDL